MPASLRARLALSFALVVAVSLLVAGGSLVALLHGYSARLVEARLDDVAVVVLIQARGMFQRGETPAQVFDFLGEQADRLGVRILLLDRAARVIQETGQGASLIGQRLPLTNEAFVAPRQPLHGQFSSARDRVTYQYSAVPLGFPRRVGEAELLIVAQPEGSLLAALGSLAPRLAVAAGAGLLATLLENRGIVLERDRLLEQVWGYDYFGETRTVDVHVMHLRDKIAGSGVVIETIRGLGYKLVEARTTAES